jgi:HlyD family secretion protein
MAPGGRVLLTRWGGDHPLEARIRLIEPSAFTKISALGVEEQRVRVIADITSPEEQWRSLGDGYRVDASFVLWEGSNVLQTPASALFRHGSGWAVFVVDSNTAHRRVVQLGHRTGLTAEILGGLKEGELVIPHPDDKVTVGAEIKTAAVNGGGRLTRAI